MTATEEMQREHEAMALAVLILEKLCGRLANREPVNPEHFGQVLEFIELFGDRCHHGKEEEFFFPAMRAVGISEAGGMLGVMKDHERSRMLIRQMAAAWQKHRLGDGAAAALVIRSVREYSAFLRHHISIENEVLIPLAEERLSAASQQRLLEDFKRLEIDYIGAVKREEFRRNLDFLKQTYLETEDERTGDKRDEKGEASFRSEVVSKWKLRITGLINRLSGRK